MAGGWGTSKQEWTGQVAIRDRRAWSSHYYVTVTAHDAGRACQLAFRECKRKKLPKGLRIEAAWVRVEKIKRSRATSVPTPSAGAA